MTSIASDGGYQPHPCPDDPEAAGQAQFPEPMRPMDTSDIDPETGEAFGVGGDDDDAAGPEIE